MWSTPRPCSEPQCGKPTVHGSHFCADHQSDNHLIRERKRYDAVERAPYHNWYSLAVWRRLRILKLHGDPMCERCLREPATEVDHKIAHKGDWTLFLTLSNLQSLCHRCHSRKTATEDSNFAGAHSGRHS